MKRIVTAAIVVAALVLPAPAMALSAGGAGKVMLSADGWYYEELPDGTIHSIYITVTKRPGARFGNLWFTESWGKPVRCDNGTKRPSDDWMGYEWTVREGSGRVAFKMNRNLRHALAEGDIPFQAYTYSDCDWSISPGAVGGAEPGGGRISPVAPDRTPSAVPPFPGGPTLHLILALDGYGRLQRYDVIAFAEDARCLDGPDGTRCGGGRGAYREARGFLVIDDILYNAEGRLSRMLAWDGGVPVPMPAAAEAA